MQWMFWTREKHLESLPGIKSHTSHAVAQSIHRLCCQQSVFSKSISVVGHNVGKLHFDYTNTYGIPKPILMCVSVLAHEQITMPSHMPAGTAQLYH